MIDWERLARAETHDLRLKLLQMVDEASKPVSPVRASEALGERLGNVSYHMKELAKKGLIEVVEEVPRRGAMEHLYAMTREGS